MNPSFLVAQDFNKMLVVSVFFHLLFLTTWIFLPQPKLQPELIVPAFMVSLDEILGGSTIEKTSSENILEKPRLTPQLQIKRSAEKKLAALKPIKELQEKPVIEKSNNTQLMKDLDTLMKES